VIIAPIQSALREVGREKLFAFGLMAFIEAILFVGVVIPFVASNNLLAWDMAGHLMAAEYTQRELWPFVVGWNPWFFCGYPQNQLYPPLLAYLSASLGWITGVALALKLIVSAALLSTPITFYWLGRSVSLRPAVAALGTLAMTLFLASWPEDIGGTLRSTFEVGNLANALGLPLSFAYVASLRRAHPRDGSFIAPTALLALVLISHLVAAVFCLIYLVSDRVWVLAQSERGVGRELVITIGHGLGALVLSAFFSLVFVARLSYGSPDALKLDELPATAVELAVGYGIFLMLYALPFPVQKQWAPLGITAAALFFTRAATSWGFTLIFIFVPHAQRFRLYDHLLIIFLLVLLGQYALTRPRLARAGPVSAVALAAVGLVWLGHAAAAVPARGVPDQPVPRLAPLSGRVFVLSSPLSQVSHHAVQHLIPMTTGNAVGKGLFLEAGANALALMEIERAIAHPDFPSRRWALLAYPPEMLYRIQAAWPRLLARLGFSYLLTNESLNDALGKRLQAPVQLGAGFKLYQLERAPLVEPVSQWPRWVRPQQYPQAVREWLAEGGAGEIFAGAPMTPGDPTDLTSARIQSIAISPRQDRWRFIIDAPRPIPVIVKASYFPNWRAYQDGRPIPVYRAAPYLMGVVARGKVELRFEPTWLDRITAALSAFGWLALGLFAVIRHIKRRSRIVRMTVTGLFAAAMIALCAWTFAHGAIKPASQVVDAVTAD
jgi:hypothetical protein